MSFKGKTYSRKGPGGKSGNPFDRMMKEQCNKPVAAKSAGIVGKWGVTSFKSVRATTDSSSSGSAPAAPKVKKFFKSRTENPAVEATVATVASAKIINIPEKNNSKKFFRSKNKEVISSEETPPDPTPSRSTRLSQRSGGAGGGGEISRSPLQSKDWRSPGDLQPAAPTDHSELKKPGGTRTRRNRQNHSVPEENPLDKESRLLALFNSQSKENQPSDKPRKSKSSRSAQESQKRKIEEPDNDLLPPIKLKLSLSKSSISDSDKYQVVQQADQDCKDISNGVSKVKTRSGESFKPWEENIIEQSDLELLDGDFNSINKDLTSQPSLPKEPTKKLPRKTDTTKSSSVSGDGDPFEMLLNSRPTRGTRNSSNISEPKKLPSPVQTPAEPVEEDVFDKLMKSEKKSDFQSRYSKRRRGKEPEQTEERREPETITNPISLEPVEPVKTSKPEPPRPSYKKTIFKSRAEKLKPVDEVKETAPATQAPPMNDPFSNDFDRVPPIIPPVSEPKPPPPPKPAETKSRNKFFKSKNKVSDSQPVSDFPSLSKANTFPASNNKKSNSNILRSPSPDNIHYPARIATPSKEATAKTVKKSIFKHKAKESGETKILPKKALSLYKHRMGWGGDKDELRALERDREDGGSPVDDYDDFDFDSEPPSVAESDISFAPGKLTRVPTYPTGSSGFDLDGDMVTQVKCPKSYKEYYTVIKNVKSAHEINDHGEFQEFTDDVEYICDGMKPRNKISARCLAAISLAQKCMTPQFRMHLRAHGEVSKFFCELKDAPYNSSLALCTSTILFVLSQDRLNMDMDRESLELLLNLLDTDCNIKNALDDSGFDKRELEKNKQKVIDICTEMKSKGHAGTLNLDKISADHLAMETLLSMTSKRAGEWFKEELRELGGLAHLARSFTDCVSYLTVKEIRVWTEQLTEKLKKANRILRVIENISHENEENCNYLIEYGRTVEAQEMEIVEVLQRLFKLLDEEVQLNPTNDMADKECIGVVLRDTLFSVIRVHINLVHDYRNKPYGSLYVGEKEGEYLMRILFDILSLSSFSGCMYRILRCIFIMPYWFCPLSKRFEALVLSLTLLINMVEHSDENR